MRVVEAPAGSAPVSSAATESMASDGASQAKQDDDAAWPEFGPLTAPQSDVPLSDGSTPAGLKNIGNTCYLNSVLQYFFTIKDVRDQVMQAAAVIQRTQGPWHGGEMRVGGRLVSPFEIERSRKFVVHLATLFDNMITSPATAVEPERELAYLALVSSRTEEAVLSTQNADQVVVVNKEVEVEDSASTTADTGAEKMDIDPTSATEGTTASTGEDHHDAKSQQEEATASGTLPTLTQATLGPSPVSASAVKMEAQAQESLMQLGAQQDVGECLDNVVFQIEVGLRSAGAEPGPLSQSQEKAKSESVEAAASLNSAIERLFVGISSQRVVPVEPAPDAQASEPKREIFTLIPIDITHEGCDVYDGLDNFFDDELIEGSNVRRTVTLQDPPAILQIQAQRVLYDRLQGKAFKALTHLEVGETLSLDRYLELPEGHPKKAAHDDRRAQTAELRKAELNIASRRSALMNGKTSIADTLTNLSQTLQAYATRPDDCGLDVGDLNALQGVALAEASEVQKDLEALNKTIAALKSQRSALWEGECDTLYELCAVFMHRGEATHGHYFLHQRCLPDPVEGTKHWLRYNDEQVGPVALPEVLKDSTGATPYLLIYVRRRPSPTATIETIRRSLDTGEVHSMQT